MNPAKKQNRSHKPVKTDTAAAQMSSPQRVCQLLGSSDIETSDRPVFGHRQVRAGQRLVRTGDAFKYLYVVNGGCFKTNYTDDSGSEQVMNFPMKGALIGADGIGTQHYINDIVALTDADVIVVPFHDLAALTRIAPRIEESLFRSISQQLIDEQLTITAIGSLCVETRLARFLLKTGDQMGVQGYSRDVFILQMSRQDIGSYLGMKIETVSRTLTAMTKQGLISVDQREIGIVDRDALEAVSRGTSEKHPITKRAAAHRQEPKKTIQCAADSRKAVTAATPWSGLLDIVEPHSALAV